MGYKGVITPMMTPFRKDGSIDFDGTTKLLNFLEESGVSGVFPLGSTGLFPWLNTDEKKKFISHVVENSGKMVVIAGVGSADVNESVELSRHAKDAGADASVLMPTYYIIPSQEWTKKQFERVLSANDMDFFVYNIPQLAGSWIEIDTMKYLKENYGNVIGAKESSGDMRYFSRIVALRDSKFDVFQGQDDLLHASLSIGASGGVCGLSNFTEAVVSLYDSYTGGNHKKSLDIQLNVINPLIKAINVPAFPTGYYHAFYRRVGVEGGYRLPMVPPGESETGVMNNALEQAGRLLQTYK